MWPLGLFLLASAFLLPDHFVPWTSFQHEWLAGLGAAVAAASTLQARGASKGLAAPVIALMIGALALVPLAQFALGHVIHRSDAVLAAAYLLAFTLCVVCGREVRTCRGANASVELLAFVLAASVGSVFLALAQWLRVEWPIPVMHLPPGGRPYANLGQPNHLATLSCLGIVATLLLFERRRFGGLTATVLVAVLGWGAAMTQSRTAWLFVALLVVWWWWQRRRLGLRLPIWAMVGGTCSFAVAAWVWQPVNKMLLLAQAPSLESRLEAGTRWIHWPTMWDAAWRAPWFGYGWGQIALAQQAVVLDHPPSGEWLLHSHNLILDLMVYNGAALGLAVTAGTAWWFVHHARRCGSVEQWAVIAAVGTVFTHALVEYPLHYLYFLLPTGLMMGLLEGAPPVREERVRMPHWLLAGTLAALTGLLIWVGVEYFKVDSAVRQLRFALLGLDDMASAPPASVWLLDQPREFHRFMAASARPGMTRDELVWMRDVVTREPRPPAQLRYALAAGLNGQPLEAQETLRRLCMMHPAPRCDEGRTSWVAAQQQHPVLRRIPYPSTPAELR
jgi:hypothetical protein